MNTLKIFVAAFCGGCVLLGTLYVLVPSGNISKPVKFAICLCFLLSVLTVALNRKDDITPAFSYSETDFENERLSAEAARLVFAAALDSANIKFSKITVFTDKSQTGGISITKVYVYTSAAKDEVNAAIGSDDYGLVIINE